MVVVHPEESDSESGVLERDEVVGHTSLEREGVEDALLEGETVESDTFEELIDVEGVQETVIEGQLVDSPQSVEQAVDTGHVESQFREDDTVHTDLLTTEPATRTATAVDESGSVETDGETADVATQTTRTVTPTADEEGKTVVNAARDDIGMVVDVEEQTLFVDPEPSITDKIMSAPGWGDHDEDTYPMDNTQVSHIEEDRIVLGDDITK